MPLRTVRLLQGHHSFTLRVLQLVPGVIEAGYTGEIKVMVQTIQHSVQVTLDSHIAPLMILPLIKIGKSINKGRGSKGLEYSDTYCFQQDHLEMTLITEGKTFKGLSDTGTDVSVFAQCHSLAFGCSNYRSTQGRQCFSP